MLAVWCCSARRRWPELSDSNICQRFGQWTMPRICSCLAGCSLRLCGWRIIWETGRLPCLWAWLIPATGQKNSNSVGEFKDILRKKQMDDNMVCVFIFCSSTVSLVTGSGERSSICQKLWHQKAFFRLSWSVFWNRTLRNTQIKAMRRALQVRRIYLKSKIRQLSNFCCCWFS